MTGLIPKDPANKIIEETAKIVENFLSILVIPALKEGGGSLTGHCKIVAL